MHRKKRSATKCLVWSRLFKIYYHIKILFFLETDSNAYSDSIKYNQLNFFKKPSKKIIYLYLAGVSDLKCKYKVDRKIHV